MTIVPDDSSEKLKIFQQVVSDVMSGKATVGDLEKAQRDLKEATDREVAAVKAMKKPKRHFRGIE